MEHKFKYLNASLPTTLRKHLKVSFHTFFDTILGTVTD